MFKSTQPSNSEGVEAQLWESGSIPGSSCVCPCAKTAGCRRGCECVPAWLGAAGSRPHVAMHTRPAPQPPHGKGPQMSGQLRKCTVVLPCPHSRVTSSKLKLTNQAPPAVHSAPACRSCGGPGCPQSARCSRELQKVGRAETKSRGSGIGAGGIGGLHICL